MRMTQVKGTPGSQVHEWRQGPYPQFLLFGDSLTQQSCKQDLGFNFMPALQNDFIRNLDVINRGFSGYNTAQAKAALPNFMPTPEQAKIEYMIVFFGANDACLPESQSGQHVPLDEYAQNLKDIVTHPMVRTHNPRLILITPPPINEYQVDVAIPDATRTAEVTREYAVACRETGKALSIQVLDLWSIMMAKVNWKEGDTLVGSKNAPDCPELRNMLSDGLHFLAPGYKILYESLIKLLSDEWPDNILGDSTYRLPVWGEAPT